MDVCVVWGGGGNREMPYREVRKETGRFVEDIHIIPYPGERSSRVFLRLTLFLKEDTPLTHHLSHRSLQPEKTVSFSDAETT